MTKTEAIKNGSFDAGNAGWTGTDMETYYNENSYMWNGSGNRVAESDGNSGQRTVMEQNITVNSSCSTDLTFRTALRPQSSGNAGTEGFRVDVVDTQGNVIATQTYFPQDSNWTAQSLAVNFPGAGTYIVRFTELGPDDSLGAIIDDVSMLICFVAGTMIETDSGPRAVETLVPGDLIWTLDAGYVPLRWISHRDVCLANLMADHRMRPVIFAPGSLGDGLPVRRMAVSPQHRIVMSGWKTELYFGLAEVLVSAKSLVNGDTIRVAEPTGNIRYVHFLLDGHQIVLSDGVLTESFFPSSRSLAGVEQESRAELLRLFPDICYAAREFSQTARPVLRRSEAVLLR